MSELPRPAEWPELLDAGRPSHARVYSYWLGGKDHFAADRAAGDAVLRAIPSMPRMVRENRRFLVNAVRHLVADLGVRQFLDIGCGLPAGPNVHEVAQGVDPTARVVYVDHDPVVLAHSRALMISTAQGRVAVVAGDARRPREIRDDPDVLATLDWSRPIALMVMSMLHCVGDDDAQHIVATLVDALPPGSYLAVSHLTADFAPDAAACAVTAARHAGLVYHPRSRAQIADLLSGLDPVEPGVVPMRSWPGAPTGSAAEGRIHYYVGMARKP